MPNLHYAFIQPLLDNADDCAGYLTQLANQADPDAFLTKLLADPNFSRFNPDLLWLFPATVLCETTPSITPLFAGEPDSDDLALATRLHQAKRKVALRALPGTPLLAGGTWDYLLIPSSHARTLPAPTLLGLSVRSKIIATEVYSHADHDWAQNNDCFLCTSEYLLTRAPATAKADTTRARLLKLLALIAEDANTPELERVFRQEPKLSYSLLRLVNSAAVAPRTAITSFAQAINLLGRRQLQRWLQLLVYADPDNGMQANPLLQKAAARGHLLEMLINEIGAPAELEHPDDAAFMVGSFSLLDILLNRPLPEIIAQLPLIEPVRQALAEHSGVLGQLLQAISYAENGDLTKAAQYLSDAGVSPTHHLSAQLATLYWATSIQLTA